MTRRALSLALLAIGTLACSEPSTTTASWRGALSGERTQTQLTSQEPREFASYGAAVAQFDDELWVGEPGAALVDRAGVGRIWPYRWDGSWQVGAELRADSPEDGQRFGARLAVGGDQVFVGAPGYGLEVAGSVQVFSRTTHGSLQGLSSAEPDFGRDFALAGDRLLVGATGTATLFRRDGDTWLSEQVLKPQKPDEHRDFGYAVGLSETWAAVAASNRDTFENEVTLFERQVNGAWLETKTITGITCSSLALDEQRLFIGETISNAAFSGAVHVLSRAKAWQEVALLQSTASTVDFGKALSLSGDTLSVLGKSVVAVFALQGEHADEVEQLWASSSLLYGQGLSSLSVSPNAIAVGAPMTAAQNLDGAGTVLVLAQCSGDASCGVGRFCAPSQRCETRLGIAAACERDTQCDSGHCADGVCCDAACSGACEACAERESPGRCVAVSGTPRGERDLCIGQGVCGGSCTGLARSCSYPAARTPCGSSCTDGGETRQSCDGAGACQDEPEHNCGDYACRDDACLGACVGDDDCRDGATCVSSSCVELSVAQCTRRGDASIGPLGSRSCGAYRCDEASGACLSACSGSGQCASGYVCDAATRNCVREAAGQPDSGCSCRTAGAGRRGEGLLLVLLFPALLARRRGWRRVLGLGALLLGSPACHGIETEPAAEDTATSGAALSVDAIWVPGSRLSGEPGFGSALAASGSSLLVGGDFALEWLTRSNSDWQRLQRVEPAELPDRGCPRLRVELDDDLALVSSGGGARVFLRSKSGQFEEQARLLGEGADAPPSNGCFIALRGKHAAVADYWQTSLFERRGTGFLAVANLPGRVLALTDESIVVAFAHEDTFVTDVNVYGPWGARPQLLASLPQPLAPDGFSILAVADSQSLIVAETGRVAYAYDMLDLGEKPATLRPSDDHEHFSFGSALALSGDILLMGEGAEHTAHVFRGAGRRWRPTSVLQGQHDITGQFGNFGDAVAIQNDELLIGSPGYALGTRGPFGAVFVHGQCSATAPCPDGYFCAAEAFCVPAKPLGATCDTGAGRDCSSEGCAVCETGHCVDGVCCEGQCGGQCEACGEADSPGSCVLVAGAPRGPRQPCLGGDDACRGSCSGQAPACVYPTSNDACGISCEDGRETPSTCNGRGDCVERSSRSCLGFSCGDEACLTSCQADADCASGFACREQACVAIARAHSCSKDGTRSEIEEGEIPCGFYRCDELSGDCRQECTEASDCAAGLVCDVPRKQCVRESRIVPAASGCGCRLGRAGDDRGAAVLPALAMLCWLACRRRRPGQVSAA